VTGASLTAATRIERAWEVLGTVLDPEVPVLSVRDLGIVREIRERPHALEIVLTPTYSGCPATEVIEQQVRQALEAAGLGPVQVRLQRAPAWTSDWISSEGRQKLRDYGIAPPQPVSGAAAMPVRWASRLGPAPACPRCGSTDTTMLSPFGATACKALCRCRACREPFEYFKPL
jgi:ring-1,2-phenylacetyl-CoA epoxidase subunit PaaD